MTTMSKKQLGDSFEEWLRNHGVINDFWKNYLCTHTEVAEEDLAKAVQWLLFEVKKIEACPGSWDESEGGLNLPGSGRLYGLPVRVRLKIQ